MNQEREKNNSRMKRVFAAGEDKDNDRNKDLYKNEEYD